MENGGSLSVNALQQILDAAVDGVVRLDRQWQITFANKQAADWAGKSGTVLGEVFLKAFPWLVYEGHPGITHLRKAMEESVPSEFEAPHPGPRHARTKITLKPVSDGMIIFFRDVSLDHAGAPGDSRGTQNTLEDLFLSEHAAHKRGGQNSVFSLPVGWTFHHGGADDLVHDAVICTDLEGIITSGNQHVGPLYGTPAEQLIGTSLISLFPEEYRHVLARQLVPTVLTSGQFEGRVCNLPSSRGDIDIQLSALLLLDESGEPAGMLTFSSLAVASGTDLEEVSEDDEERQLQALKSLEESAAIMRTLVAAVEHAQDVVLITEAEPREEPGPRILYVNQAFTRMTGYTPGEVIGKTPRLLQGPNSDRAAIARIHAALASWKPVREELINYRKDGTEFHVELSIVPIADEKGWYTHWVSIQRETTEQNTVRLALRESEARLRTVVEALPQLLWTADAQGRCTYVSESCSTFLGLSLEACLGSGWAGCIHPEDRARVMATWHAALLGNASFVTEYRLRRYDGAHLWFLHRAQPRLDASGNVIEWIGTSTDIEAQKKSEQALRRMEKLAAVGKLASSVAHEINNPLESVMNLHYLLEANPSLDLQARKLLETAQEQLARIAVLTTQSVQMHRQSTPASYADIPETLDTLLTFMRPQMQSKEIKLTRNYEFDGKLFCQSDDIRHALGSILSNAMAALSQHGDLRMRVRHAFDQGNSEKSGIRITVADNGCGIPAGDLKHIFDAFFTGQHSTGTGLGLWVTKEIVERHAGRISVRSTTRPGRSGTVFSIFLPFLNGLTTPAGHARQSSEE